MSQENVDVVRASIEAWNSGDMDAFGELHDPEVIVRSVEGWPEPGPYVGREAFIRQFKRQREAFEGDTIEVIGDFIEAADRVVARLIWRGRGHGPESRMELTCLYTIRKGRIFYREYFWDHAEALEAAGLSEQDAHTDS